MRFDHFLPFLSKPTPGQQGRPRRVLYQRTKRILPAPWFSSTTPRKVGLIRKWLRRLGITWQSAPFRRLIQTVCFAAFLLLFFYVCWPYRAIPEQRYSGWIPLEIDVASGKANLTSDNPIPEEFISGQIFHLSDVSTLEAPNYLGPFELQEVNTDSIILAPQGKRTPEELEQLSFSLGPWTLSPLSPLSDRYKRRFY